MVWKKFTELTGLAVTDKDPQGIYSHIDAASNISYTHLLMLTQNTSKKQQLSLRFC